MPTYRKLHTKTIESQDIIDMPDDFVRFTWLILPLVLSRDGTTIYQSHYLCSKLYPLRPDVTDAMVARAFFWYEQRGMLLAYEVDGRRYLWIPTFGKYQGDSGKEAASPFPAPPASLSEKAQQVKSNSIPTPDQLSQKVALDVDVDVDSTVDVDVDVKQSGAKKAPASLVSSNPPKRKIDHSTVPEVQDLRLINQAIQRGCGYPATESIPTGKPRDELRRIMDDNYTPADVEGCTRWMKSDDFWGDKAMPVHSVADALPEWIKQGRPARKVIKTAGNGIEAPPLRNADGLTYNDFVDGQINGRIKSGVEWHPIGGGNGNGKSPAYGKPG